MMRVITQSNLIVRAMYINGAIAIAHGDTGAFVPMSSIILPTAAVNGTIVTGLSLVETQRGNLVLDLVFSDVTPPLAYISRDGGNTWDVL